MNKIDCLHNPFVLLSAEKAGASNNVFRSLELNKLLKEVGLRFKPVKGSYNGIIEDSFYIEIYTPDDFEAVKTLARYFDQESVLVVNNQRSAVLFYLNPEKTESIGKFTQVSEFIAISEKSYTYDIVNNGYYICK